MLALVRTYEAFGVHGHQRPDPTAYFADPANPLAAAKNSFNIILTLISDAIIVSRRSATAFLFRPFSRPLSPRVFSGRHGAWLQTVR